MKEFKNHEVSWSCEKPGYTVPWNTGFGINEIPITCFKKQSTFANKDKTLPLPPPILRALGTQLKIKRPDLADLEDVGRLPYTNIPVRYPLI